MSGSTVREFASDALRRWPRLRLALRRAERRLNGQAALLAGTRRTVLAPRRILRRAVSSGPSVEARFVGVLDGHTLNLDLVVPPTFAADLVAAEVHFVRGPIRLTAPACIRHTADGPAISATVLLCGRPDGLALETGQPWLLECSCTARSGQHRQVKILGGLQDKGAAGPTVAAPPCPDSGWQYRAGTEWSGQLSLTVTPPPEVAEVAGLRLDWIHATLDIRAVGWIVGDPVVVEFKARGGGEPVEVSGALVEADLIRCELPFERMAAPLTSQEAVFDVRVRAGSRRLRVGTLLHDLANPKATLRPPTAIVWAAPGRSVRVRPYFTPAGALALACLAIESSPTDGKP